MVYTCCVCKWRANKDLPRSFHKFPSDEKKKQKWLNIIGKSNAVLGARAIICSIHFEKKWFHYGAIKGRTLLKKGSVPSLHLSIETAIPTLHEGNESEVFDSCETYNFHHVSTYKKCFTNAEDAKRNDEVIEETPKHKIKDRGKLTSASSDVIEVCLIAEQIMRETKVFELENVKQILIEKAMKKIPSYMLDNEENCLGNHRILLIKNILDKFFQVRLHYESTQEFPEEIRIRAKNTKIILFKHQ